MSKQTLNQKIFVVIGGLLCLSSLAILFTVWWSTNDHAKTQLQRDLQVAQSVLSRLLASREQQLINSADVLTADFGFKQAVASRDQATILSALVNHGERISADVMSLLSLEGEIISSTSAVLTAATSFPAPQLLNRAKQEGGATSLLQLGDKLYQIILLTVDAPRSIAVTLLGFEIDQALVNELKAVTQLDVTIRSAPSHGEPIIISSLAPDELSSMLARADKPLNIIALPFAGEAVYSSQAVSLTNDTKGAVTLILSENLVELFDSFSRLQYQITLIAVLTIALAFLMIIIVTRTLTQPLTQLAEIAKRIALGDYHQTLPIKTNSREIDNLTTAFDTMQRNIEQREDTILFQASHDLLTGLYNRNEVSKLLQEKIDHGEPFMAISINVLDFRGINDTFGYQNGDGCLAAIGARLHGLGGLAARLNGGEMLWIPPQILDARQIVEVRRTLEAPVQHEAITVNIKLAIGTLEYPRDADDVSQLLRRINIVVDHAQRDSKAFASYQQQMEEAYLERLNIIAELKQAITNRSEEFTLNYQPKLGLQSGDPLHAEALLRWNNPLLGFVSPELFIPLAEHAGLINQITVWVVQRVIEDLSIWRDQGIDMEVAVNLSIHDLKSPYLLDLTLAKLQQAGLPLQAISFEVTESGLMDKPEEVIPHLQQLRDKGFKLAIDDFGTGYSSLAYLKSIPASFLKIDKSFVLKLDTEADDQNIVKIIMELAHKLNMAVVAEGVENQASLELLQAWGCEWAQGYHLSKPVPAAQIPEWLSKQESQCLKQHQ